MKSGDRQYRFGPFVLIPSEHALLRDGKPLHLARRDFELLVVLVDHAGRLLRKEELQERLWPQTVVEEGNLTKHVSTLRKALGDVDGAGTFIETVPRVGFRFTAPVTCINGLGAPPDFPCVSTDGRRGCAGDCRNHIGVRVLTNARRGCRWLEAVDCVCGPAVHDGWQ